MWNIADWPLRKPLAIYASLLVGVGVIVPLWRGADLPTNITNLLIFFASGTVIAYFASSTTESIKGVTAYEANYSQPERECMEMDTVGRSVYADPRGSGGVRNVPRRYPASSPVRNRPSHHECPESLGRCRTGIEGGVDGEAELGEGGASP